MNANTESHAVELTTLQVLNLRHLVGDRINEMDRLAVEFPHLPMKDPYTYESYCKLLDTLNEVGPSA